MRIPNRLENLLHRSAGLHGAVLSSFEEFEPWIKQNRLTFFSEYTDHGLEHIERVLLTADALIRDDGWEVLTAGDVAVLVLGTLLHDCAMHLTEDGFVALVNPNSKSRALGFSWTLNCDENE